MAAAIAAIALTPMACYGAQDHPAKWQGVDETVVGKFAEKAGRPARKPLIDTDRGDLPLFLFLVAGAAGGFIAGYYFRELFPGKTKKEV
jgi:cobalt/nickel transport protein